MPVFQFDKEQDQNSRAQDKNLVNFRRGFGRQPADLREHKNSEVKELGQLQFAAVHVTVFGGHFHRRF